MLAVPESAATRVRRARPLLGTLVEIEVTADDAHQAHAAIDAAFAEIALVHRLMSVHAPDSTLCRLNRAAPGELVEVDARTAEVLALAEQLRHDSGGAFDAGVAGALVAWGALPPDAEPPARAASADGETSSSPIAAAVADAARASLAASASAGGPPLDGPFPLIAPQHVRRGDRALDLGGIAKGYAVDRAVELLLARGIESALVNAGGDLRHAGPRPVEVALRDPCDAARIVARVQLRDCALASSATHPLGTAPARATAAPGLAPGTRPTLVDARDPVRPRPLPPGAGVTIVAPRCVLADALTKLVLVTGRDDHPLLSAFGARVIAWQPAAMAPA